MRIIPPNQPFSYRVLTEAYVRTFFWFSRLLTMAKKKPGTVPNRHVYTRISFLYQASAYLARTGKQGSYTTSHGPVADASVDTEASVVENANRTQDRTSPTQDDKAITASQNMSRRLLTDIRAIAQKSVIRVSPDLKRSMCKYCDALLVEGQTSSTAIENKSKGGKKPWADVLVVKCHACGGEKRFPVSPLEHKRRHLRNVKSRKTAEQETAESTESQTT